jgi:ribosome maturation factor RimP
MGSADPLAAEIEQHIESLGFELVEMERSGASGRPIFRLRIDRPDSLDGEGVTLEECAAVNRSLQQLLDGRAGIPERYVLEISSPGVERPLVRPRDFERFAGREVAVLGRTAIHGSSRRVEGVLIGLEGEGDAERVRIRLASGEPIDISRTGIRKIHLVFRWADEAR